MLLLRPAGLFETTNGGLAVSPLRLMPFGREPATEWPVCCAPGLASTTECFPRVFDLLASMKTRETVGPLDKRSDGRQLETLMKVVTEPPCFKFAEGKKQSIPNIIKRGADTERANIAHYSLEKLARGPPSASTTNYISDHVQETDRKREVEGISGIGKIIVERVGPDAQKMTQMIESEDSNGDLFSWSSFLRLHDFLENLISNQLPKSQAGSDPADIWLSTFAKSQFQACIPVVEEELLRVLPATMNGADMERVQSMFTSVLKCELALLDSAYSRNQTNLEITQQSTSQWHPSNIIFTTDFDVTCTVVDSCETLVKAAEVATSSCDRVYPRGKLLQDYEAVLDRHAERTRKVFCSLESQDQSTPVGRLSKRDANTDDLVPGMDPLLKPLLDSANCSLVCPGKLDRDAPCDEAGLRSALSILSDLEVLCNQDVIATGVLRGPTREEIKAEATQVQLRPNCDHVLRRLVEVGTAIHVVSANWSRDLIVGGLPELPRDLLFTHCNDLLFDETGVSRGIIDNSVVDAFDKEQMIQTLRKIYKHLEEKNALLQAETPAPEQRLISNTRRKPGDNMLVYLGDSHTDLLGLLEADLGIVIGDTTTVRRVMSIYGIQLLPLAKASAYISLSRSNGSECSWRRSGILFEAQGWEDVETCLFGMAREQPSGRFSKQHLKSGEEVPKDQYAQEKPCFDTKDASQGHLPPFSGEHFIQVAA